MLGNCGAVTTDFSLFASVGMWRLNAKNPQKEERSKSQALYLFSSRANEGVKWFTTPKTLNQSNDTFTIDAPGPNSGISREIWRERERATVILFHCRSLESGMNLSQSSSLISHNGFQKQSSRQCFGEQEESSMCSSQWIRGAKAIEALHLLDFWPSEKLRRQLRWQRGEYGEGWKFKPT